MSPLRTSDLRQGPAILLGGLSLGAFVSIALAVTAQAGPRESPPWSFARLQVETATPTETPTPSETATAAESPTATETPQDATPTPEPSVTASATETGTPIPEATPTLTPMPVPTFWLTGSTTLSALFGFSVGGAGDVNRDGWDDVLIGARDYRDGEFLEGAAFVYLGSASGPGATPDWMVESNQAFAAMGNSVDIAGDLNGDGFADILVGAPIYSLGEQSEGVVFGFYGSPSGPSHTPDWTGQGNQASGYFGWSVSGAGDVNGDGFDDAVVGARYYDNGQADEGRAFLYLGSATGLGASPAWTAEIDAVNAGFGYSVSGAGDVNGDGHDDVLVTSYNYIFNQLNGGKAYLFLGSTTGLSPTPSWIGQSGVAMDGYGNASAGAGNVNGDGFADILVGAPAGDNDAVEGKVYLYTGSPQGPSQQPTWIAEDGRPTTLFGASVSFAGDFNADGYGDIVVGDPIYTVGSSVAGAVFVYLGGAPVADSTFDLGYTSGVNNSGFGHAVGGAGHVNGDGFAEFLVGAPIWTTSPYSGGRALLFFGRTLTPAPTPNPTATPTATMTPSATPTPSPTPTPTIPPDAIFFDDFERGDLSAWSAVEDGVGDLRVTGSAAVGGSFGLQADIDDIRSIYAIDDTPAGETAYRARFYFDPNSLPMGDGNAFVLFQALGGDSALALRLELRFSKGDYNVRASAARDRGSLFHTPWVTIADQSHLFEVEWTAATDDASANGRLVLWVDGIEGGRETTLDNSSRRVESVRLGAVAGIDGATRGSCFFDSFGSTQFSPIGPDPSITLPSPPASAGQTSIKSL